MRAVIWGPRGAGKSTIAARLGLPEIANRQQADLALVVFDVTLPAAAQAALYEAGARETGISRVVVAANKMDLAGYEYEVFKAARRSFLSEWQGRSPLFVPVSARYGDYLLARGDRIDWYEGPALADLVFERDPLPAEQKEKQGLAPLEVVIRALTPNS